MVTGSIVVIAIAAVLTDRWGTMITETGQSYRRLLQSRLPFACLAKRRGEEDGALIRRTIPASLHKSRSIYSSDRVFSSPFLPFPLSLSPLVLGLCS